MCTSKSSFSKEGIVFQNVEVGSEVMIFNKPLTCEESLGVAQVKEVMCEDVGVFSGYIVKRCKVKSMHQVDVVDILSSVEYEVTEK